MQLVMCFEATATSSSSSLHNESAINLSSAIAAPPPAALAASLSLVLTCMCVCLAVAEARKRTGLPCNFTVRFYGGRYFSSFGSVFPIEDIVKIIPEDMVRCRIHSMHYY